MTILLSGGGSGGHITPLLAVASELKKLQPSVRVVYVGQRGDKLSDIPAQNDNIDEVYMVRAGKWRRYHGEGIKQLLDVKTIFKNVRDFFRVLIGMEESWRLLGKVKPDVIFIKGGFVGVPVGLSAAIRNIPYITHDSDAIPGLANRIIARWASAHAVAMPKEMYWYPNNKTFTVGVPIGEEYKRITPEFQKQYRRELGLDEANEVVLVTGGGLGAERLNYAVSDIAPNLFNKYNDLIILHTVGRDHEDIMNKKYDLTLPTEYRNRVIVKGFVTDLYRYSGAADVIIARAGATNIAEFAVQAKACVLVPNPQLTAGHQLKNAEALVAQNAVMLVNEAQLMTDNGVALQSSVEELLDSPIKRDQLGERLAQFAHPHAAHELAELLLKR